MLNGNNGAHHIQHHQLVNAGHDIGDEVAGNHLPALGLIQDLADEHAQEHGNGNGNDRRQNQARDSPNLPVSHENQADLTCHSAQGHAEVQAHASHNGNEKAQNQECISAQTGHNLIEQVACGEPGGRNAVGADQDEHNGHGIVAQECFRLLAQGLFAQTGGIVFLCHDYLPPSVFRVSA